jgi:hypothetical protein
VPTMTVHRSSITPQFLLAVVGAVGLSFYAGERVGFRLASSGAAPRPSASQTAVVELQAEPGGPGTADASEPSGIGPDCNTNYR